MTRPIIAFIGGGNMARSLVTGLIAGGFPPDRLWVADPDSVQRELILEQFAGVHVTPDNDRAAIVGTVVLMAVKPQVLRHVAQDLMEAIQVRAPLILSIAAGVRANDLERWLGGRLAVVRCMPNAPALVRNAATGMYANFRVSKHQRDAAEMILRAVGETVWLEDEELLDAVTALSGSGPAYFLLVMEAMEQAGVKLGLAPETARRLVLQTALGAAKLAHEGREDLAVLRARVTSTGGTTERAVTELEKSNLFEIFERAVTVAAQRARELGDQLAGE
jgi:pyrroline-5-carboxylate reductase